MDFRQLLPVTRSMLKLVLAGSVFSICAPTAWSNPPAAQGSMATPNRFGDLGILSTNNFDAGASRGFFANLGSNGRTCATCHVHDQGETITPLHVRRVASANRHDPLFAPVDGSDCPPQAANQAADARASSLLMRYGVIRVQLAIPLGADFSLADATNPRHCAIAPGDFAIGNALFLFRRPLPSSNLHFLSTVMWDGRETPHKIDTGAGLTNLDALLADLSGQINAATTGHAQAPGPITGSPAQADILAFERHLYTAQIRAHGVDLTTGNGGPTYLAQHVEPAFFIGQNDPLKPNFSSKVFTLYANWEPNGRRSVKGERGAIGRGERFAVERLHVQFGVPRHDLNHLLRCIAHGNPDFALLRIHDARLYRNQEAVRGFAPTQLFRTENFPGRFV